MRQVPLKMFCVLTRDQGMRRGVVGKAYMWLKWGSSVSRVHVGRQRV